MYNDNQHERNTKTLGILLLAVGAWTLASRFFRINFETWLWPFWIIIPGGIIITLGFRDRNRGNEGLVTFGSIVAVTGIVLFIQNITGQWQSWAYAWALLFPGSIGLGKYLWGRRVGNEAAVRRGEKTMQTAVVMFVAFGLFFELVLGIGGFHLGSAGRIIVPVLLIAAGAALYITSTTSDRGQVPPPSSRSQTPTEPPQPPVQQPTSQDDLRQNP